MVMMQVPPYDPKAAGAAYTYARIADHLAARIAAGEFPPDSMLPNERELAGEYEAALNTLRRALDVLRDRGLVVTLPAKGTFVARRD